LDEPAAGIGLSGLRCDRVDLFDRACWRLVATCLVLALCLAYCNGVAAQRAKEPAESSQEDARPRSQSLTAAEGRAIVAAAREHEPASRATQDCSHIVHEIYGRAGFSYPYLSSFDLYSGSENFERINGPQVGDVIVWPGHVGIVADPKEHLFYSLVSSGLDTSDYEAPYWKARGRPRFYRYLISGPGNMTATTRGVRSRATAGSKTSAGAAKEASERTPVFDPVDGSRSAAPAIAAGIPRSILIAEGRKAPTREEAAAGISELSSASGSELRSDSALYTTPVIVFEQMTVARLELKRDRGWAFVQLDQCASLWGNEADLAKQTETVRWELRRGKRGWEAVSPYDRTYVPRDVAVRNIAARLSQLTQQDAGDTEARHREEARLTRLLSVVLEEVATSEPSR
jgi:NlpC/P60 family